MPRPKLFNLKSAAKADGGCPGCKVYEDGSPRKLKKTSKTTK